MLSLNASLSLASQALQAENGAIGITNNNIANVNTPGYSRQVVNLSAEAISQSGGSIGNGVAFGGYTSVRDQLLQISINTKTSQSGSLDTQTSALTQIQTAFSGTTSGIGAAMSTLFSTLSSLSSNPTDASARQSVLSSATQLANAFRQGSAALASAQTSADAQVVSTVAQINQLTKQIASLNGQLQTLTGSRQEGGSLQDQRDQLTAQLAQLTGISQTQTEGQPTLTTGNGSPLVVGDKAYALQVTTGPGNLQHVIDASGMDVTSSLSGGTLGGALTIRDTTVPGLLTGLNSLATQFASAINTAQGAGFDATGASGQPLFTTSATNPSATLSVALSGPSGIAVSSDGSSGSSGNLANLLAVGTSRLPSGQTPIDSYASLVASIGNSASQAAAGLTATNLSLSQLNSMQSATSGVSLDEESTNLIRYQQAYTAAAHVISTVNSLFSVVMNMSSGG